MVISYIHSICWCMKSLFYERQPLCDLFPLETPYWTLSGLTGHCLTEGFCFTFD
jgi:hypothetical protein